MPAVNPFTTRPELKGTFGMVASTHWLASAAGMAMLEAGGNAFDAAVAAGFVLQVVEPHMNGPGGDVVGLYHHAASGATRVVCGQGGAPAAATLQRYSDLGLDAVPGTGFLAAVVPGAMDAWLLLLAEHGSLDLATVLAPAIGYADRGFPLVGQAAAAIAGVADLFRTHWPTSAAVYLPGDRLPEAGRLARNPVLAAFYRRLLDEAAAGGGDRAQAVHRARAAFYRGFAAEAIDRFCRTEAMDTTGRPHAGLLSADDLAGWSAHTEDPVSVDVGPLTVCKPGPWTQGPVFLQQLRLLEHGPDLAALDPQGPDFVHRIVESAKLALADREAYYGDPAHVDVPLETLLSADYAAARARLIGDAADHTLRPGTIPGCEPVMPVLPTLTAEDRARIAALGGGEPTRGPAVAERPLAPALGPPTGDTCHLDVVDRFGNMVAMTPSGGWLQSSPVVPELGFALGTRGQMFSLTPGTASALAPGRRPRTTLSATLVLDRDRQPCMAFGTPGGDQQDQWTVTFFLRWLHHGLGLQQAIDMPSFHTNHAPSSFWPHQPTPGEIAVETRLPAATLSALEARGHRLLHAGDWALGRLCAVARTTDPDGTLLHAASNPRLMQGYAVGR